MKTFTVTIHHTTNYGAILQAYALQQSILTMGAENEIFEYKDNENVSNIPSLKDILKNPTATSKRIIHNCSKLLYKREIKKREDSFALFHDNYMLLSRTYDSMEDLRNNPPDVDVLFTGSDQVWRFSEKERFTEARFLDFGNKNTKKYSYAASIERLEYTEEQKELVKKWLKDFNGIALREQNAADYIHSITGYKTQRVIDPVLLLEKSKWNEIVSERKITEPYILCYQVQSAPRMQEIVDHLKRITGFRTVAVLPYSIKWIKTDDAFFDVSPNEFLYLISRAEIVVSASFHGVALGVEFDKIVYATGRNNYCDRIKEIMKLLNVDDFFVPDGVDIPNPDRYPRSVVTELLHKERKKSLEYLSQCLYQE